MTERQLIRWIAAHMPCDGRQVPVGIGDDMAMVSARGGAVFITVDMLMDGVDFLIEQHTPEQVGRKALAASLSDCAAMCVRPTAALVSLALPNVWTAEQVKGLYAGMQPLMLEFGLSLAGGDTNCWRGKLAIDVVLLAEAWDDAPPVRRHGARPGDWVCVSGPLGGSILGRHLSFVPRVNEARALRRRFGDSLHAMMDISDGLAIDLSRLCETSGVGAELHDARLVDVIHADARDAAAIDGQHVLDHVLGDGEDFELLYAVAADAINTDERIPHCHVVGRITTDGFEQIRVDGTRATLAVRGWEHVGT